MKTEWTITKKTTIFETLSFLDITREDITEYNNNDKKELKAIIDIITDVCSIKFNTKISNFSVKCILLEGLDIPITAKQTRNSLRLSILGAVAGKAITESMGIELLSNIIKNNLK